jgi:hypothetical protein
MSTVAMLVLEEFIFVQKVVVSFGFEGFAISWRFHASGYGF